MSHATVGAMSVTWQQRIRGLFGAGRRTEGPVRLVFYTRSACPLCDEMESALERVRWKRLGIPAGALRIERRDVESDPSWEQRYGQSIPVLEFEGRALAKGRATTQEIERRLARRLEERIRG
ncbi:MAG TPA: glutaredoxin family protein [Planctomycetes bacterium]|nr:glutaredoxin family protein [Planctomycetota bacterium]